MLQQTLVSTVRGYYERFLSRFPTVADLAQASESDVLLLWQGLGYYRRARNLHRAAKRIVQELGGRFPDSADAIAELPGLGRYTANAIACFAYGHRTPILEANTIRVWTRLCSAEGDPARQPLREQLWNLAEQILPRQNAADLNQALMDLGAMVCTSKSPRCGSCPVQEFCRSFASGRAEEFPQSAAKRPTVARDDVAVVLWKGSSVLVVQRPDDGPWAGLWEFPRVELAEKETWEAGAARALQTYTKRPFSLLGARTTVRHGIMHYKVRLQCWDAKTPLDSDDAHFRDRGVWTDVADLGSLPFSSPQRRVLATLQGDDATQGLLFD
jgi:A/G-specific adenine glycosylase